jgi:putative oxidoreductase
MERYSLVAARILISIIFLLNGLSIIGQTLAEHEMAAHGVPVGFVPVLIMGARALQLIAGTTSVLGIYPRVSAIALLLFPIPATLMAHAFWQAADTSLYPVQLINFFKNVCIAGGLVFIAAAKDQPALLPRSTPLSRMYTALLDWL